MLHLVAINAPIILVMKTHVIGTVQWHSQGKRTWVTSLTVKNL